MKSWLWCSSRLNCRISENMEVPCLKAWLWWIFKHFPSSEFPAGFVAGIAGRWITKVHPQVAHLGPGSAQVTWVGAPWVNTWLAQNERFPIGNSCTMRALTLPCSKSKLTKSSKVQFKKNIFGIVQNPRIGRYTVFRKHAVDTQLQSTGGFSAAMKGIPDHPK